MSKQALNQPRDLRRAEIIRDKGTNRQQLFRGEVDKYTWVDFGSSYSLSDLLAAYLYAQLEARDTVSRKRKAIWETYDGAFRGVLETHGVRLPHVSSDCVQSHFEFLVDITVDLRAVVVRKPCGCPAYLLEQMRSSVVVCLLLDGMQSRTQGLIKKAHRHN